MPESSSSGDAPTAADGRNFTSPGLAVGTITYMSPEQARGEAVDVRSDPFSLGVVLYEAGTGRKAFGGSTTAVMMVAVGFVVSANQLHRDAHDPRFDVLSFETIPFLEQVCFAVLAGAAFALRKKAAAHKRLILLATFVMMAAAFSRFPVQVGGHEKFAVYAIYLLLGFMVLYDLWSLHRVHGATVFGALLILAYLNFAVPIGHTAAWRQFALWMQSFNL
ncbi:MAG TPA: hypothetical protein VHZ09_12580 [Acidobacteriaceae bacterium]|nr:hypothetical protein [Acidobacteriaceae bacterium]